MKTNIEKENYRNKKNSYKKSKAKKKCRKRVRFESHIYDVQ